MAPTRRQTTMLVVPRIVGLRAHRPGCVGGQRPPSNVSRSAYRAVGHRAFFIHDSDSLSTHKPLNQRSGCLQTGHDAILAEPSCRNTLAMCLPCMGTIRTHLDGRDMRQLLS